MSTQRLSKRLKLSLNHVSEHIKGTRNHHQFVPEGSSMRMICISGSTFNVDNHIIDTNRMDLNDITPGSYYACKYDNNLYFCTVNYVSMEHGDVNVKFVHPKAPAKKFFWPIVKMSAGFA